MQIIKGILSVGYLVYSFDNLSFSGGIKFTERHQLKQILWYFNPILSFRVSICIEKSLYLSYCLLPQFKENELILVYYSLDSTYFKALLVGS